ncbi:uncharacterized protein TNCT_566401 [Trichonephila clavata]|uniref:Uncharacterized protein n=1 Tax=Trichonephila clavata TaxID=2740835 RepID=A0A8X6FP44_TRICU|nr:uncharacterized protein TNCT_566401 [Trichonephila clavata]
MSNRYQVISISFSLDSAVSPFRIITDTERFFNEQDCVISIKAFCGDVFVITLCGRDVVKRVKTDDRILLNEKIFKYKIVETNITSLKIEIPYYGIKTHDVNRLLLAYGNVMLSEILGTDKRIYHAFVELKRDLPAKIKCKYGFLYVVEIV